MLVVMLVIEYFVLEGCFVVLVIDINLDFVWISRL